MKAVSLPAALVCVLLGSTFARAQDPKNPRKLPEPVVHDPVQPTQNSVLEKIDRKIAKEPAYQNTPRYCLVVFGRETKLQVWVVVDGDTVYVDLNGNGDLTEKGEAFKLESTNLGPYGPPCDVGDILDPQTERKHTKFQVTPWDVDAFRLSVEAAFESRKAPSLYGFANVTFASKPANAPIVHFGGRLSMELSMASIGDRPAFLCAEIGTPGVGKGSFVYYTTSIFHGIDAKLKPDLEIEYPGEKNTIIREKAKFYRDGIESVYRYPVEPGEKGDKRQAKITLSFPDWWAGNVAPRSFTRPIVSLKK